MLVTNQSGIARGKFSEDRFLSLTQWMDWNFVDNGVEFDGFTTVHIILSMASVTTSKIVIAVNLNLVCLSLLATS